MADFEDLLRDEVARHRDGYTPSSDLTDRIHARVAQRRRERRVRAGAAGLAAAAAVVIGVLVAAPSAHDGTEVAREHDSTTSMSTVSTTAGGGTPTTTGTTTTTVAGETGTTAPTDTGGSGTGSGSEGGGGTTGQSGSGSGTTTGAPEATSPPTTAGRTTTSETLDVLLAPNDGGPADTCVTATGSIVEIVLYAGAPSPQCVQVTADQRLRVRNSADKTVTVSLAGLSATIDPGGTYLSDVTFGALLDPGLYQMSVSIYGGSGPDIWLS